MSILGRIFLALYSILFIALIAGLVGLLWNDSEMIDLSIGELNFQAFFVPDADSTQKWAFTALMAALCLLGLVTLMLAFTRSSTSGGRLRMKQADGGVVELDSQTIERILVDELQQIPEVRQASAKARADGNAVNTILTLVVEPNTSIAQVTDEANRVTARALREEVGVENVRRPTVRISYDETGARQERTARTGPPPPPPADSVPMSEMPPRTPSRQPLFPSTATTPPPSPAHAPDWGRGQADAPPAWETAGAPLEWNEGEGDDSPVIGEERDDAERKDDAQRDVNG